MTAAILILDADAAIRDTLREILVRAGYAVRQARDRTEALHRLAEAPSDLVIIGMHVGNAGDIGTVADLRQARPGAKLVAATTDLVAEGEILAEVARGIGVDRILPKPIRAQALLRTVRELLGNG